MVIYKKLCYATSRGRMDFNTKYPNCRKILVEPGP